MKRVFLLAGLGATGFLLAANASAATMPTSTITVGSGAAAIAACDPDGFTASAFTTSGGKVTSVTIGGIAGGCQGGSLSVVLTQGTTSVATGGPVPVTATAQVVPVTGSPNAWDIDGLQAVVIGP